MDLKTSPIISKMINKNKLVVECMMQDKLQISIPCHKHEHAHNFSETYVELFVEREYYPTSVQKN